MERGSSGWSRAAAAAGLLWSCFHVWRAFSLSITTDEAFTFHRFVAVRWLELLRSYDANHHLLHSMLCKMSVGWLGPSEWSLRLPALAGMLLYLFFAQRLAVRFGGGGPATLASFLWMAGMPQIAEYLSLARGYSLGLGFLWAALWLSTNEHPRWNRVSACLGLSVASNLVFVIPAAVVGLYGLRRGKEFRALAAPSLAVLAWVIIVPLQYATMGNYYFGAKTWNECVHSLLLLPWLKAAALCVALLGAASAWRMEDARIVWRLLGGSLAILGMLFVFRNIPLPYERTGIYLLALLGLLAGPACRWGRAELPLALLASAVMIAAAGQVPLERSGVWTFDASSRDFMARIRQEARGPVQVAASFPMEQGLEFYRCIWLLRWPAVVQWREGSAARYLLWRTDESQQPLPPGYVALARDSRSGVILARRLAE